MPSYNYYVSTSNPNERHEVKYNGDDPLAAISALIAAVKAAPEFVNLEALRTAE